MIGYAGLLDLGYVGFYAVGAYTTGVLTSQHWHWPFFLALPIAIAVTMVTGVILGAPTLRVRGDYLAIVTLGLRRDHPDHHPQHRLARRGSAGIKDIPSPPSIGPNPIGADQDGLFQIPHLVWNGLIPSIDNAHKTPFLVFDVLDAIPYYWLLLTVLLDRAVRGLPDQGEPGRAGLGGHPGGRGRRRADGRPDVPLQAARLRPRCGHRRSGRLDAGLGAGRLHQPRPAS